MPYSLLLTHQPQTTGTQIFVDFCEIEQEKKLLQKQLEVKQDNEQWLRRQLKAFVDELQKKKKGKSNC